MPIFKKPPFRGNADKKRDMPEGLWHKCPGCGEVIHELELKKSLRVCPHCNYHFTLSAPASKPPRTPPNPAPIPINNALPSGSPDSN